MPYSLNINDIPSIELLGVCNCCKGWHFPLSTNATYELIVVKHGNLSYFIDNREYVLTAGDSFIIFPGEEHYAKGDENDTSKFYFVHFNLTNAHKITDKSELVNKTENVLNVTQSRILNLKNRDYINFMPEYYGRDLFFDRIVRLGHDLDKICSIFESCIIERNKPSVDSEVIMHLMIQQVFVYINRATLRCNDISYHAITSGTEPVVLQHALFYIHNNFTYGINVADVCRHLNVSSQYLGKVFNKHLDTSPLLYINKLRISRAKELLWNSDMNIKDIAVKVGIENPYYFSRLFKQIEGVSPTKFLKSTVKNFVLSDDLDEVNN